jgi:hypothetical protein
MFNAPAAPELVAAWYQDQMKVQGWSLLQEVNSGGQIVQTWQKGGMIASVSINLEAGGTQVLISWTAQ